jgi:hypothetical protein
VRHDILHGRGLAERADNAVRDSSDGEFDRRQRVGFGVRECSDVRLGAAAPASWSVIHGKAPQVLNMALFWEIYASKSKNGCYGNANLWPVCVPVEAFRRV